MEGGKWKMDGGFDDGRWEGVLAVIKSIVC